MVNNFTNVNKANKHLSSEEKIKGEKKNHEIGSQVLVLGQAQQCRRLLKVIPSLDKLDLQDEYQLKPVHIHFHSTRPHTITNIQHKHVQYNSRVN